MHGKYRIYLSAWVAAAERAMEKILFPQFNQGAAEKYGRGAVGGAGGVPRRGFSTLVSGGHLFLLDFTLRPDAREV